jgi:hypothetical protein
MRVRAVLDAVVDAVRRGADGVGEGSSIVVTTTVVVVVARCGDRRCRSPSLHTAEKHSGRLVHMAPHLEETNDIVEALDLYDGDVIEHPATGSVMTVTAHMHMDPHYLHLIPGVVRFDVYSRVNANGPLRWDGPQEQLVILAGRHVRRLYRYVLPPGARA